MNPKFIDYLKRLAQQKCWDDLREENDEFVVNDYAGGNVDDAYSGGETSGETILARDVLKELGINWPDSEQH
jgi:hypothetical protein